jgi:hypothetical protein
MKAETAAGRDAVFVDDAKAAEAHLFGVVVVGEGERVVRVEPAMLCMTALAAFAKSDHVGLDDCIDIKILDVNSESARYPGS